MDRHTGRFVNHDKVFVLIYNVKGKADGRNLLGASGLADANRKNISRCKLLTHIVMDAIDKDALRHSLDFCQILAGIAAPL